MTDDVLRQLSPRFARLYPKTGLPSVARENCCAHCCSRSSTPSAASDVRSERLLMEQLEYNLLFRWFVGLSMDDPVWDVTMFTKNRERLLRGDVAEAFFQQVLGLARAERLFSESLRVAAHRARGRRRPTYRPELDRKPVGVRHPRDHVHLRFCAGKRMSAGGGREGSAQLRQGEAHMEMGQIPL
jgi:transposase